MVEAVENLRVEGSSPQQIGFSNCALNNHTPHSFDGCNRLADPKEAEEAEFCNHELNAFDFSLTTLVDKIESLGPGVILAMGEEGAGKTAVAATIAPALAYRVVQLTTTDPAAHLSAMVILRTCAAGLIGGRWPNLTLSQRREDDKALHR